jgi:hypothetical protein
VARFYSMTHTPYVAPTGALVAVRLHALGCYAIELLRWAERFGADYAAADRAARDEQRLDALLPLALARGCSTTDVAEIGGRWLDHARAATGTQTGTAQRHVDAAIWRSIARSPDAQFNYELHVDLIAHRGGRGYHLVQAAARAIGLCGRTATVGAGGEAEQLGEHVSLLLEQELGALGARLVKRELVGIAAQVLERLEAAE